MTDTRIEPVAAQVRFRRPEKGLANWSAWQQTSIKPNHPAWSIDGAGYEVEYRLLFAAPQAGQPTGQQVPEGWLRAIDEALVVHHIGVANETDLYEDAKRKLNLLLCCVQDIGEYFAKERDVESTTQQAEQFCDGHCTWLDHHPDCVIGKE